MKARGLVFFFAALCLAGCGGTDSSTVESSTVSLDVESEVVDAEFAIATTAFSGSRPGAAARGVDRLIAICRENPDAIYQPGMVPPRTLLQVVEDSARTVRKAQPDLAAKLDEAVLSGCE